MENNTSNVTLNHTQTTTHLDGDSEYTRLIDCVDKRLATLFITRRADIHALIRVDVSEVAHEMYLDAIRVVFGDEERDVQTCSHCGSLLRRLANVAVVFKNGEVESLLWEPSAIEGAYLPVADIMDNHIKSLMRDSNTIVSPMKTNRPDKWTYVRSKKRQVGPYHHFYFSQGQDWLGVATGKERVEAMVDTISTNFRVGFYRDNAQWLVDALKKLKNSVSLPTRARTDIERQLEFYTKYIDTTFLVDGGWSKRVHHAVMQSAAAIAQPIDRSGPVNKLNGTTLGNLIERAQTKVDRAIADYLSETDPLTYRQSDKTNVQAAEAADKYFIENGLTESLALRIATLEELRTDFPKHWTQTIGVAADDVKPGPFAKVKEALDEKEKVAKTDEGRLEFKRESHRAFITDILPTLKEMSLHIDHSASVGLMTTMANKDAPCLFKWSPKDEPFPYAWCFLRDVQFKNRWANEVVYPVCMVVDDPAAIGSGNDRYGQYMFVIENDGFINEPLQLTNPLFPEILRDELYPHRKTVMAYNKLEENGISAVTDHLIYSLHNQLFATDSYHLKISGVNTDNERVGYLLVM